jgi:hypothetical protein
MIVKWVITKGLNPGHRDSRISSLYSNLLTSVTPGGERLIIITYYYYYYYFVFDIPTLRVVGASYSTVKNHE